MSDLDDIVGFPLPKGAVAVTSNLDMLTEEPLELVIAIRRLAESKMGEDYVGSQWTKIAEKTADLVNDLKRLNEPPPKVA